MGRYAALCLALVIGCGARTGFSDDSDIGASATGNPTGPLPSHPGAGSSGGSGGFRCPSEAPRAGTSCDLPPGTLESCGRYERANPSDRTAGDNGCPVLVACADGLWRTVDCHNVSKP